MITLIYNIHDNELTSGYFCKNKVEEDEIEKYADEIIITGVTSVINGYMIKYRYTSTYVHISNILRFTY